MDKNCPMRHENENCLPAGGFCTANKNICEALLNAYGMGKAQLSQEGTTKDATSELPTIQPEPSIPVTWIEKYTEQLNCTPGIFAELRASIIEAMLSWWKKGEPNETD